MEEYRQCHIKDRWQRKAFSKKYDYVYDEYYDCMICPANEILRYSTTNREAYREYKSDPEKCKERNHRASICRCERKACDEVHSIQRIGESKSWGNPPLCVYEFKKACETESDKRDFWTIYSWLYSNIGSSNTKIGCKSNVATDFVYSLKGCLEKRDNFFDNLKIKCIFPASEDGD